MSIRLMQQEPNGFAKLRRFVKQKASRVQNSVFELLVDPAQLTTLKAQLEKVIDPEKDSVRFYRLGSNWRPRIDYMGRGLRYEQDDTLIL